MKIIKLLMVLSLFMVIMKSCTYQPDPEVWEYQLIMFTFQDASGKDLVKDAIEPLLVYKGDDAFLSLSENFYTLKVIYPQPCMDALEADMAKCRKNESCVELTSTYYVPKFDYNPEEQDFWELIFKPETSDQCAKAKMLTLLVTSPIFGDDREQEFIIHFDGLKISRILMNDKECSFIQKTILDSNSWSKRIMYKPQNVDVAFVSITL